MSNTQLLNYINGVRRGFTARALHARVQRLLPYKDKTRWQTELFSCPNRGKGIKSHHALCEL